MPLPVAGQSEETPPSPLTIDDFGSLNTRSDRTAIGPNEFSWIENWMPIGPGNLRTLYAEDETLYTVSGLAQVIYQFPFNREAVSYIAIFKDDGTADEVNVESGVVVPITSLVGTFYLDGMELPGCAQWQSKYLVICAPFENDGYWLWDGTSLFGAGTLAPDITILNSGDNYTSAPTVTAYGGSGTGATFSAEIDNEKLTKVTVTNPGSGYLLGDKVNLVITGGGSDNQARATALISNTMGVGYILIANGGSLYSGTVTAAISGGGGSGATTAVTGASSGTITEITVTNPGSGYTSVPTVTITGTTGSGATAVAVMRIGVVDSFTIDNGGTGYDYPPDVVISEPDSTNFPTFQAEATATITAGVVTAITVQKKGLGYTRASVDLSGGNDAGEAQAMLMPFGIAGGTLETYQSRVWVAEDTKVSYTAPGSVADFGTVLGGGSYQATDSFLRRKIVRLIQTNGFLYQISDSSINVISNVQTSSTGTTSFNNSNIDPQIGSAWRDSVVAFGRALVFANPAGVYALYGGAAEKVSANLDGLFANASFNTATTGLTPTAAVAIVFGIRIYCLQFTSTNPYTQMTQNLIMSWDGQRWFGALQNKTPIFLSTQEIDSQLDCWATDGTEVYKLFQVADPALPKIWQGKFSAPTGYWKVAQVNRVFYVAKDNIGGGAALDIRVDFSDFTGRSGTATNFRTRSVANLLTFFGTGPIQFTGLAGADLFFGTAVLVVDGYDESAYGNFIGSTVKTTAPDLTMISLTLIQREYAAEG